MRCKYCGQELPDNSVFCTNCGKPVKEETGSSKEPPKDQPKEQPKAQPKEEIKKTADQAMKQASKAASETVSKIQNSNNVKVAKKSLSSGLHAIHVLLKDPTADVVMDGNTMIVIVIFAVIAHTLFMIIGLNGIFRAIQDFAGRVFNIGDLFGAVGYASFKANIWMSILFGLMMTGIILVIYFISHMIEERNFGNFRQHLSGAVAGLILPSVFMLAGGIVLAISPKIGFFLVLIALVSAMTYMMRSFTNKTNQYVILIFTTLAIALLLYAGFDMADNILTHSTVFY